MLWLAANEIGPELLLEVYQKILTAHPNHIGSLHYLTHLSEDQNKTRDAETYAHRLAELVPNSAHAQHMLGHTLPQMGRWDEALKQFEKAHDIHLQWAEKNGFEPNQDWHFSHNLDLMAAAHLALGNFEKARDNWHAASAFDHRAKIHFFEMYVLLSDRSAIEKEFESYKKYSKDYYEEYLKPFEDEVNMTPESVRSELLVLPSGDAELSFENLKAQMKFNFIHQIVSDKKLLDSANDYFSKMVKAGGFDGWSNAYLELLRFKRMAQILSMTDVLEGLKALEFAIQSGSLCSTKTQNDSAVPCK